MTKHNSVATSIRCCWLYLHARVERAVLNDDGVVFHGVQHHLLFMSPSNAREAFLLVHFEPNEAVPLLELLEEHLGVVVICIVNGGQ